MKRISPNVNQKGEGSLFVLVVVVLIAVGVYFTVQHFKNRNNDIVIHVPKVEVH